MVCMLLMNVSWQSSHKCVRQRCSILDSDCQNLPLSKSFNYIAFSSNFLAPAVLFKIATVPDRRFSYRFKFLDGHQGGEFALMQSAYVATINVMRSIEGPKEYNLDVEMEVYQRGVLAARYVSKIFFNISEYPF
ncbi:fibulin-7-like [Patiria miniata]|uniref:Fibulin C-terminal Ig-like domain-containing protein n=1 Tax=Patiria miniata TaxID=46514 RepID=A0A914ABP4_PATMI|nr:fibulin-7-like [Patiria miniata]